MSYSAGDVEAFLALRRLSPLRSKISEFSTSRSTMAVAMVVLKRMLPHSENALLVVISEERFWRWRVENDLIKQIRRLLVQGQIP